MEYSGIKNNLLPACLFVMIMLLQVKKMHAQTAGNLISWPDGKKLALSLSLDDARLSDVDTGTAVLNQYKIKATFYVLPGPVKQRLEKWKQAVADGHEIGSHSNLHPCSGYFSWSRDHELENYTLEKMQQELLEASRQIEQLLGVKPEVFAYPCGATSIGKGKNKISYVPLIDKMFISGRGESLPGPNNLNSDYFDIAELMAADMDEKNFDQIVPLLEKTRQIGGWLILGGHEVGDSAYQTTRIAMLKKLCEYALDPANGIWVAPVGTVTKYILSEQKKSVKANVANKSN